MEHEIWLPVEEYESRYAISNHGNIVSLGRTIIAKGGSVRNYKEKKLKLTPNKIRGYVGVRLYNDDGSYWQVEVHRLVALHFLDNASGLTVVNHKDTIRHNNHVDNLEWTTHADNLKHKGAHRKGREKIKKRSINTS